MATTSRLHLTGERTLPGLREENYWFQRHAVAYGFAAARAAGRAVLDAGCGEGYGLELMAAGGATRVIGADLSRDVIGHVEATYVAEDDRIEAVACELMDLPLDDDSVDLVVSFQVIEHLYDVPGYLASLRRVTRPGGEIVISTPNRLTFTPDSDTPVNPFHVHEFSPKELREELTRAGLDVTMLFGLRHGPLLRSYERLLRRPLPDLLAARPAADWGRLTRRLVGAVKRGWFELHPDGLEATLDLIAVSREPLGRD